MYKLRRLCKCCLSGGNNRNGQRHRESPQTSGGNMEEIERNFAKVSNIITNSDFGSGLDCWHPNCCHAFVAPPMPETPSSQSDLKNASFVVVTDRTAHWQGLEQDITAKVLPGFVYQVCAHVGVSGPVKGHSEVLATLKLEFSGSDVQYLCIGKICTMKGKWEKLEGTFSLPRMPDRVVFYLEGPSPGIDLLIHTVSIHCENPTGHESAIMCDGDNIIVNPNFDDGLNNWSGRGCQIGLHDSMADGKIVPKAGKSFACATERKQSWNGIQQELTGRVQRKRVYEATTVVRIFGNNTTNATVRATLWVQNANQRDQYIGIANVQASDKEWVELKGKFLLNGSSSRVVIYLEGPPPGIDILVNSLVVKHAEKAPPLPRPYIENPAYGMNIITNSQLERGKADGWFPLGNCKLSVKEGSPYIVPAMARESLGDYEPLSGRYIHATDRTQTWMGPAQMITDKLKLFLTYQISAWVRIRSGGDAAQNVNIALGIDSQWVNGGQVEISDDRWHEIGGSFRVEKKPDKAMVYVQGPAAGVDLMVAGLMIFPVDREARIKHLRRRVDLIRKRDIVIKISGAEAGKLSGAGVRVWQTHNSFPLGACISRMSIDNEDFVNFFVKNFNWAVFCNELKWYWTEPQRGNFNYQDADDLLNLCENNNIETRGHCIFWDVESTVQQWVQNLSTSELAEAVRNRLFGLLARYKGKFRHYDVNNEMLHGSFYQNRLGKNVRSDMFKTAHEVDPSALLFVNDYHVEDGCDPRSCPERYMQHILELQEQGAPVGGVGIQGHIDSPVGPIVCAALDKLSVLGLPIWFTELDVSSVNDNIRGDDLEVMLWEAFAHPAVQGIVLWGFWELLMSRDNSHLVEAEGEVNEAGKRLLAVKRQWLSHARGRLDDMGEFAFRGHHGTYTMEIDTGDKMVVRSLAVDEGMEPLLLTIDV